jgi:hypothetical protein
VKSKFFYYSVTEGFRSGKSYLKYLSLPFKMLKAGSLQVIAENVFRERVPQTGVIFNEANSEEYFLYTGVPKEEIHITGVPFFDSYYRPHQIEKDYAVYIDHPYLEDKLLDWSPEFHHQIAIKLSEFARENRIHVYVKLHPRSSRLIWEQYNLDPEWISIIQLGDYTELFLEAKIILGFSSSLMNGFLCAKKNVVLLGWHPSPHIFGADFSKTGLCHVSFTPDDLKTKFNYWKAHNLTMEDQATYEAFLRRFNYPFDGNATERVFQAVTGRAQLSNESKPIAKHHVS